MRKKSAQFITKQDSMALYGIAILMMIFHHCFCIPSRLNYDYIPVLWSFDFESRVSWLAKFCVGIYAFITGYALAKKSNDNTESNFIRHFKYDFTLSLKSAVKFYSKFLVVFIIFIPIGLLVGKDWSFSVVLRGLIGGVQNIDGNLNYINGEWWYIKPYLIFMLSFPFIECLLFYFRKRESRGICVGVCACLVLLVIGCKVFPIDAINQICRFICDDYFIYFFVSYMVIFLAAVILSKFDILEWLDAKLKLNRLISILLLVGVVLFRWFYATEAAQSDCDMYLTPILVFALVKLLHTGREEAIMPKTLRYLGKYSTFMWLTHTFWIYYYFQPIILLPRYSLLIYVWATLISLGTGIALDYIYSFIGKTINSIKKTNT